jgi:hypothetical protein
VVDKHFFKVVSEEELIGFWVNGMAFLYVVDPDDIKVFDKVNDSYCKK